MLRDTIIGLDFSGAANAGDKIWVTLARVRGNHLKFEYLERASNLPDGASGLEPALGALISWVRTYPDAAIGCDFPFALTEDALNSQSWKEWLTTLHTKFESADAFRAAYSEIKRETDVAAKTPFAPLNLRLYRQTFYGLRDVLAPLVQTGAAVAPFTEIMPAGHLLLEVCPASLLKRKQLYLSYKGKSPAQLANRQQILDTMTPDDQFAIPEAIREKALHDSEGDALDAILCALISHQVLSNPDELQPRNDHERNEGRVYY